MRKIKINYHHAKLDTNLSVNLSSVHVLHGVLSIVRVGILDVRESWIMARVK